jgi:hypothetical protein
MIRWLFRLVTLVSTLLFVASLTFWVRSYWRRDYFQHIKIDHPDQTFTRDLCTATTGRGGLSLRHTQNYWTAAGASDLEPGLATAHGWIYAANPDPAYVGEWFTTVLGSPTQSPAPQSYYYKYGFAYATTSATEGQMFNKSTFIIFPLGVPTLLFGIIPFFKSIDIMLVRRRLARLRAVNYNNSNQQPRMAA